jgi:hypothetical protein
LRLAAQEGMTKPYQRSHAMRSRQPSRVIPFPDRQYPAKRPAPSLFNRMQDALDELQICLFAMGILAEFKIKRNEKED